MPVRARRPGSQSAASETLLHAWEPRSALRTVRSEVGIGGRCPNNICNALQDPDVRPANESMMPSVASGAIPRRPGDCVAATAGVFTTLRGTHYTPSVRAPTGTGALHRRAARSDVLSRTCSAHMAQRARRRAARHGRAARPQGRRWPRHPALRSPQPAASVRTHSSGRSTALNRSADSERLKEVVLATNPKFPL